MNPPLPVRILDRLAARIAKAAFAASDLIVHGPRRT